MIKRIENPEPGVLYAVVFYGDINRGEIEKEEDAELIITMSFDKNDRMVKETFEIPEQKNII